ncbi:MAG TPA: hypothetical protein VM580_17075, partial [Labilithrix sp.]|nr:hypothetical protein [Labilithrix sp.]
MRAIVLLSYPPSVYPLRKWLGPDGGRDLIVLAPPAIAKEYEDWAGLTRAFEPYQPSSEVEYVATKLARQHRIEHIVAVSESDLLRA